MTREEIYKVVKEIGQHYINNNCRSCEVYTIHGCVFMSSYQDEQFTIEEADRAVSEG